MPGDFAGLTPDLVLDAVEEAGFAATGHCTPLTCLENRVYDLRLEDGGHVVAKFYRPGRWDREGLAEEHRFLAELAAAEIPVVVPLPLRDGASLARAERFLFALWPRAGGRSPDELREADLAVLGRLLGRLHNVGAAGSARGRGRLDAASRVAEPLRVLEEGGFLPGAVAQRYRSAATRLGEAYETRAAGVPLHRIHGDCHRGNLLRRDDAFVLLDFDDFTVGPAAADVWMLLPGRDAEAAQQRTRLVAAYREFRPFDPRWLDLVEPLRALRFVSYAAWVARRWSDPSFPDAFPHFGSEAYWERETEDLERQLALLGGGEADAAEARGEIASSGPEPSRRDFFWDL